MSTLPTVRTPSLLSILAVGGALTLAACGGSSKATTTTTPPTPTESNAAGLGTSGIAGLDWGANADAVKKVSPRAEPGEGGLWYPGMAEGHLAITKFAMGPNGLSEVIIEWTDGFVSMDDCGKGWTPLRTKLDGRFGPSQADNLAASWKTASASITLACNPNDINAGVLSLTYAQLAK
ncbi:MAG: hypothetical protein IPQ07_15990 [Myxococcales bacterium]|nr:hypothetical protein [Myxococcales bacterium]